MRQPIRRGGVLLLALAASLAGAQEAVDPAELRGDVEILTALTSLRLTQDQARRILDVLPSVAEEARLANEALRKLYLDSREAILEIELAMLRGEPAEPQSVERVTRASDRYTATRNRVERRIQALLNSITDVLLEPQKAMIETDEHQAARLAAERQRRGWRDEALDSAVKEISDWVRRAEDADYLKERDQRAAAVVNTAHRDRSAEELAPLVTALATFYDQVRAMRAPQFAELRETLRARLRRLVDPPGFVTAADSAYVMSWSEWQRFWRNPRVVTLLTQLLPALPTGGAR